MLLAELKDRLKPAFSSNLGLHIRFVSLEQAAA